MPSPWSRRVSLSSSTIRSPSPPTPSLALVNRHLDLVNTVYSSSFALDCWVFRPSWSLGPSLTSVLYYSQSIGTVRLYSTFSMPVDCLWAPHLHTNIAKRHVAHALTQWLVSKLNQSRSFSWQSLIKTRHIRAHINLVFTRFLLHGACESAANNTLMLVPSNSVNDQWCWRFKQ